MTKCDMCIYYTSRMHVHLPSNNTHYIVAHIWYNYGDEYDKD